MQNASSAYSPYAIALFESSETVAYTSGTVYSSLDVEIARLGLSCQLQPRFCS
jgi:hypothetical protein